MKAIDIDDRNTPDSIYFAYSTHTNATAIYIKMKQEEKPCPLLLKNITIQRRVLIPHHPQIISTATYLSQVSYRLEKFDTALEYGVLLLEINDKNKWSHVTKGKYHEHVEDFEIAI